MTSNASTRHNISNIYSMTNHANQRLPSRSFLHCFRSWEDRCRPELKLLHGLTWDIARVQAKNQVGGQEMGKAANLGPPCFSKQRLALECCQKEGGRKRLVSSSTCLLTIWTRSCCCSLALGTQGCSTIFLRFEARRQTKAPTSR